MSSYVRYPIHSLLAAKANISNITGQMARWLSQLKKVMNSTWVDISHLEHDRRIRGFHKLSQPKCRFCIAWRFAMSRFGPSRGGARFDGWRVWKPGLWFPPGTYRGSKVKKSPHGLKNPMGLLIYVLEIFIWSLICRVIKQTIIQMVTVTRPDHCVSVYNQFTMLYPPWLNMKRAVILALSWLKPLYALVL